MKTRAFAWWKVNIKFSLLWRVRFKIRLFSQCPCPNVTFFVVIFSLSIFFPTKLKHFFVHSSASRFSRLPALKCSALMVFISCTQFTLLIHVSRQTNSVGEEGDNVVAPVCTFTLHIHPECILLSEKQVFSSTKSINCIVITHAVLDMCSFVFKKYVFGIGR